jgi:hypothetical protein
MPRKFRIDAPGVLHHIMIRGIEGRATFKSDKDRKDFVDRIGSLLPETGTVCYAWAVIELGGISELARALGMRPSAVGYAVPRGKNTAEEKGYSLAK